MTAVADPTAVVLAALSRVKHERWICKACAETTRIDPDSVTDDLGRPASLACICGSLEWHHTLKPAPKV